MIYDAFPNVKFVVSGSASLQLEREVISTILGQDLISEFEKVEIPLLNSLINLFFSEPGMTLNYDGLARTLSKKRNVSSVFQSIFVIF